MEAEGAESPPVEGEDDSSGHHRADQRRGTAAHQPGRDEQPHPDREHGGEHDVRRESPPEPDPPFRRAEDGADSTSTSYQEKSPGLTSEARGPDRPGQKERRENLRDVPGQER